MIQLLFLAALRLKMRVESVRDGEASASDIRQADCVEPAVFTPFLYLNFGDDLLLPSTQAVICLK